MAKGDQSMLETGMASQNTANRSMLRFRTAPFTALVGSIVQFRFHNEKCFPVAFRAWNSMLYVMWCIVKPSCCCWDFSAIARLPCETTASQERMDFIEKLLGDSVQMHGEARESQDQVRNIACRLYANILWKYEIWYPLCICFPRRICWCTVCTRLTQSKQS